MNKPDYLSQGERARLFPVLSTTSKEGRTTSIVLACLCQIEELGAQLLGSVGQRLGTRARIDAYTEVVFAGQKATATDRPDGLIIVQTGRREWRALVEAKVGNVGIDAEQVERYRQLAKDHKIDCVITISNEFATTPGSHPVPEITKSRSKIPVYHWSWMSVFTTVDLLLSNEAIGDADQRVLLAELRRFLAHESAGIKGFERMPTEWSELNKLVSAGGKIMAKSTEAAAVLDAWHQETRDLSLILSRQTETSVQQRLTRAQAQDPSARQAAELSHLRTAYQLYVGFDIPDAAAALDVVLDLNRRTVEVGMTLRAPEDRKSSKARMNWLLKQVRHDDPAGISVRLKWPGRSETTQFSLAQLRENSGLCEDGKAGLQVHSFHLFITKELGGRFVQRANIITDLETIVPEFYRAFGQDLVAWRRPAPRISDGGEGILGA